MTKQQTRAAGPRVKTGATERRSRHDKLNRRLDDWKGMINWDLPFRPSVAPASEPEWRWFYFFKGSLAEGAPREAG